MDESISIEAAACPLPLPHADQIVMGHGSGGRMSHSLITKVFQQAFDNPALNAGDDAARIELAAGHPLAISTDAHVVWPLFFPGGDIGRLAVCGTVNDVAMLGARPMYLTASFILEEGLPMQTLQRVVESMVAAAQEAGIAIVAGDTKVVQKGKADGLYISTTGIGTILPGFEISGNNAEPGDQIIVSGPIGDHGIAVLAARGELGFDAEVQSDVAPLNHLVQAILGASPNVHVLRDPTRGGLATTLNEIARQSGVCVMLDEGAIPIRRAVASASEMLGFDPLYIANEGKLVVFVAPEDATLVLEAMRAQPYGAESVLIGSVEPEPENRVLMRTSIGSTRIVDMLSGEMLPRIC